MKSDCGFIVALINKGKEVNDRPEIYQVGTYAEIIDWESLDNGLLGIKVRGSHTVRILDTSANDNGLIAGHTIDLDQLDNNATLAEDAHQDLVDTLKEFSKHPFVSQRYPDINYSSAVDVCYRLGEFLPVSNITRQELLETGDIKLLLARLQTILDKLGS